MALTEKESSALARIAVEIAARAAVMARSGFERARTAPVHKGAVDLVTETDLAVEVAVRAWLTEETGIAVIGEEEGATGSVDGLAWIVDPIDGTTNFAHRHPYFAVSIGLADMAVPGGEPLLGCVHAPMMDEVFWCDTRDAWLGAERLAPLRDVPLDVALLATGFPYDRRTNPDNNTNIANAMLTRCQGIRRMGAAALDLAWLAAGRVDGFWELRLKPWDAAAGVALVRRVGGVVVDHAGAPHRLASDMLVAGGASLVGEMLEVIDTVRPPAA